MNKAGHARLYFLVEHIAYHIMQDAVVLVIGQLITGIDTTTSIQRLLTAVSPRQRHRDAATGLQLRQIRHVDTLFPGQLQRLTRPAGNSSGKMPMPIRLER